MVPVTLELPTTVMPVVVGGVVPPPVNVPVEALTTGPVKVAPLLKLMQLMETVLLMAPF